MSTSSTHPRSPFGRPRWSEDDAREVLAALDRSGQSVSVFASEHGLDAQRIYVWRRRLGKTELTRFHELSVQPTPVVHDEAPAATSFEVAFSSGHVLRIATSFETKTLARLIDVLDKAGMC
jgi:transposase-like protein